MGKIISWFLILVVILHFSACDRAKRDAESLAGQRVVEGPLSGQDLPSDSLYPHLTLKAPEPIVSRAYITDSIDVRPNQIPAIQPEKLNARNPELRTPGTGNYVLPEKVKAVATIQETQLPEVIDLKEPISRDNNPYGFLIHSKNQGLTHDYVRSFYEDPQGNMWLGTAGGGLMRFDGRYIDSYDKNQGLNINDIAEVTGDYKGNIWLSTLNGLYKINGHEIFHYDAQTGGLLNDALHSIQLDPQGNVWISYRYGGVSMFDGEFFYHYGVEQGLPEAPRHILRITSDGDVWISLFDKGLALFKDGSFHIYTVPFVGGENSVMTLTVDHDQSIWFSIHDKGVMRFDGSVFYYYEIENGFPFGRINRITVDSKGQIWFGTWGNGIIMSDGEKYTLFDADHGLANNFIADVYEDSRGVMWIAFYNGGLTRYFGEVFTHYNIKQGVDQNIISLVKTPDEKLWISTFEQGFLSFDGRQFTQYSNQPDEPIRYMEGMFADHRGDLWMSINDGGITRFDGQYFYDYPLEDLPGHFFIFDGISDDEGSIWMAIGEQGLVKFDGEYFSFYNADSGLPSNFISEILYDSKGNIWIGTWGNGVCKINQHTITCYTREQGLASDYIYTIFEDVHGNLWFGSEGSGVSLFDGEQFVNFTTKNGLTDNYILSINQDHKGNMVFGGRFGINLMAEKTLQQVTSQIRLGGKLRMAEMENILFVNLTWEDGFLGIGCNQKAMLRMEDEIWIGANDRLTAFASENAWYDTLVPRVVVNHIELFNEPMNWTLLKEQNEASLALPSGVKLGRVKFDSISPWYHIPLNLRLSHRNNFVGFGFSGVSPGNNKLQYSFKLDGADQSWHRPTTSNTAQYGNLSPGKYTFKVRAVNPLGHWGEVYEYPFTILTPWWQTWWAWLLYLSLAAYLLRTFVRYRIRSLQLKNKLLDNEVELARKSIEIKQNIIANVSHELRTPLTGIIGLTDLLADTPLTKTQEEFITTLKQTGQNLREIINQILDYSKLESGQASLINVTFSLNELFEHTQKMFSSLRNDKNLVLETYIDPQAEGLIYGDRGRINQVLHNLYYNAVKFTPQGKISIAATQVETKLTSDNYQTYEEVLMKISVTDTGIGIRPEAMGKLFVPFSQIEMKDTRHSDSTGLGLAISRKLAELLGGEIGVQSTPGQGSTFWFTFKVLRGYKSSGVSEPAPRASLTQTGPLRILLVEDKKVNQLVIRLILEKMGHTVTLAENGQLALDIFEPDDFDLVFMDIQMPVMDGITTTHRLREKYAQLPPIIGLSANAFDGDRERYMLQGMDEYITKPVSAASLQGVIERVYGESEK